MRRLREKKGLSIRGLAEAADVDATWVSRLERGIYAKPDPRLIRAVADAIGVAASRLFAAAGYEDEQQLPQFAPYLRAKYDLPEEAVAQLEAHLNLFNDALDKEAHRG